MEENFLVFTYGTLKRNEPNHHYMEKAEFVFEATTVQKFPLVIASKYNIPFALYKPGYGKNLKGEVYKVDQQTLQELDVLENHPTLYERELQEVKSSDGTLLKVWIYLLKTFKPEMLELECYDCYESKGEHGKVYISSEDDLQKPEEILQVAQSS